MARKNPADIVNKWFALASRHDLDAASALIDPNIVLHEHGPLSAVRGREAQGKIWEDALKAFPDFKLRILNLVARGDMVAVEVEMTGTFKGPYETPQGTIPPTGGHFEGTFASFNRVNSKGLIAENHSYVDTARMFQQLGVKS